MTKILTGLNALAYQGVNAPTPANSVSVDRAPTTRDYSSFNIGDNWINSLTSDAWILVNKSARVATWIRFSAGAGTVTTLTGDIGGPVPPLLGNINILGTAGQITVTGNPGTNTLTISSSAAIATSYVEDFGVPAIPAAGILNILGGASTDPEQVALVFRKNIHTSGAGNTVSVKLNDSLSFPITNTAGTAGVIYSGGVAAANRFIHSFGTDNVFVGLGSGNLTTTGVRNSGFGSLSLATITNAVANTAIGYFALNAATSCQNNTAIGHAAMQVVTTSSTNTGVGTNALQNLVGGNGTNTAIGVQALQQLVSGTANIAIGNAAGNQYTTNESNNIVIGQFGTIGDNGTIQIGTAGTHTTCVIAGITGVGIVGAGVLVSAGGQLGVAVSSERFKENIEDMGDVSSNVLLLRPVTFNYITDEDKTRQTGLIAEEVEEIMPNLVVFDDAGLPMSVQYHELPVLLLNELQKLYDRVDMLEKKLARRSK